MENVDCILCNESKKKELFEKDDGRGNPFTLVKCEKCSLEFVDPRPTPAETADYYKAEYFSKRTDRGYNDYFSEEIRKEVSRVFSLNLEDLGFSQFEEKISGERSSLDIGCAAGYFVQYMQNRGWTARGIDISQECVAFAKKQSLDVLCGDYLMTEYEKGFDLITMWASIEHMHRPDLFIKKINEDLKAGGRLYISTCRTGGINFKKLYGRGWRFYNFPEHLYFFSKGTIRKLLENNGFKITAYTTYGSGVGSAGSFSKRACDNIAKRFNTGDMMLVSAEKK